MDSFEKKALIFYTMICNAYRDEDDQEPPIEKLSLKNGGDLNEDLTAMLAAVKLFCDNLCPQLSAEQDMIGFTHLLNRLAIQYCFDVPDDEEKEER